MNPSNVPIFFQKVRFVTTFDCSVNFALQIKLLMFCCCSTILHLSGDFYAPLPRSNDRGHIVFVLSVCLSVFRKCCCCLLFVDFNSVFLPFNPCSRVNAILIQLS